MRARKGMAPKAGKQAGTICRELAKLEDQTFRDARFQGHALVVYA